MYNLEYKKNFRIQLHFFIYSFYLCNIMNKVYHNENVKASENKTKL